MEQKTRALTIVIALTDSLGHFSTLKAIADELLRRRHRVIFFSINELDTNGYEAITASEIDHILSKPWTMTNTLPERSFDNSVESAEDKWTNIVAIVAPVFRMGPKESAKESVSLGHGQCRIEVELHHDKLERLFKHVNPDLIVSDLMLCYPCIMNQRDIKWVRLFLGSSLAIYGRHYPTLLPPEWYGLPTLCDTNLIQEYRDYDYSIKIDHYNQLSATLKKKFDCCVMPPAERTVEFVPESPFMNIYMYPNALDYANIIKDVEKPINWFHVNSLVPRDLTIRRSENFTNLDRKEVDIFVGRKIGNAKLIYFSLGTLASADTELMNRILTFLAQDIDNLYIVSMGPLHPKLQLGDNMFGRKFIDQLYVLPKIDLIITHGGNNTITESFHYGVPGFVVLPVFDDQHDNARRIEEIKVGKSLDTYNCSRMQLMEAIYSVLSDTSIKERMRRFAEEIQKSNGLITACDMIENVAAR